MKFTSVTIALAAATSVSAQDGCPTSLRLRNVESCTYAAFIDALDEKLDDRYANCALDAEDLLVFQTGSTVEELKKEVTDACSAAYMPFGEITDQGDVFDKEYYDGGTYFNEQRESVNEYGITTNSLAIDPGFRIKNIHGRVAKNRGITWPDNLKNFESCSLNTAMCCFVQDRQANDDNGNCAKPYDEDCLDADPADNTDICYVDMERSPTSSRTANGFALFEDDDEGDSHCHGFAWADDSDDASNRFKANNLFYVSMYDHLTQRGYGRSVPGAPMCGCVEQMPVVSRADCTQIDIDSENANFFYSEEDGIIATVRTKIQFNACQGAGGNNNDLKAYVEQLAIDEKISQEKRAEVDEIVVGEGNCAGAIGDFLETKGLKRADEC